MEILKCNADFDKVYYVEINGTLRECKLIRTEAGNASNCYTPLYILDVAGTGIMRLEFPRQSRFDTWYRSSTTPSILYESVEDFRKRKPITDNYGSTSNAYNHKFIEPLFPYHSHCNCGGTTYTWKWDGCKAVCYSVQVSRLFWSWDRQGFHCCLNNEKDCYRSQKECERANANKINVVRFKKEDSEQSGDIMDTSNNHAPELVKRINKAWNDQSSRANFVNIVNCLAKRDIDEFMNSEFYAKNDKARCEDYCRNVADDVDLEVILKYCGR